MPKSDKIQYRQFDFDNNTETLSEPVEAVKWTALRKKEKATDSGIDDRLWEAIHNTIRDKKGAFVRGLVKPDKLSSAIQESKHRTDQQALIDLLGMIDESEEIKTLIKEKGSARINRSRLKPLGEEIQRLFKELLKLPKHIIPYTMGVNNELYAEFGWKLTALGLKSLPSTDELIHLIKS